MKYHCRHCGQTMERNSDKAWVKSYCDRAGRTVHLIRCEEEKMSGQRCETCWYWERTSESGVFGLCCWRNGGKSPHWLEPHETAEFEGYTCDVYEAKEEHEHEANE